MDCLWPEMGEERGEWGLASPASSVFSLAVAASFPPAVWPSSRAQCTLSSDIAVSAPFCP